MKPTKGAKRTGWYKFNCIEQTEEGITKFQLSVAEFDSNEVAWSASSTTYSKEDLKQGIRPARIYYSELDKVPPKLVYKALAIFTKLEQDYRVKWENDGN